jgi:hypothetical protein
MMKALTIAAAVALALAAAPAAAAECPNPNARCKTRDNPDFYRTSRQMPADLVAEWCHVGDGVYVAAERFCAKSRDAVFFIRPVGFHIRLKGVKPLYLCMPEQVEPVDGGWQVTAFCGLNDNSGPVNRRDFTFKLDGGRMLLSFGLTQGEKP